MSKLEMVLSMYQTGWTDWSKRRTAEHHCHTFQSLPGNRFHSEPKNLHCIMIRHVRVSSRSKYLPPSVLGATVTETRTQTDAPAKARSTLSVGRNLPVDDGAAEEIVVELATDVTVSVVVDEARIDDEEVWLANDDSDEVTTLKVVVIEDDGTGAEEMDEVVMIIVEEDVAREVLKAVEVFTLVTVEDDVGRVGGLAGVQLPNPF